MTAVSDSEVFEIRREHLNAVAKSSPGGAAGAGGVRAAAHGAQPDGDLARCSSSCRSPSGARCFQRFAFRALQPGEKVLVEGEHSPGLFLVLAGELVVQKEDPAGGMVTLGVLREGDVAGEISLLTGLRGHGHGGRPRARRPRPSSSARPSASW